MKILFLTNFYPPAGLGGYDQLCQEVGDALRNRGHDVRVLTSNHQRSELPMPDPEWVQRELHLEMELVSSRNAIRFFTSRKTHEIENLDLLRRITNQFSPDVALIWGMWNLQRSLPALAEQLMQGRIVYYICDHWPTLPNQLENYWNAPPRSMLTGLPKLILKPIALQILAQENRPDLKLENAVGCSEYIRNTLVEAGKVPDHTGVLRNGISPGPFVQAYESGNNPAYGQSKSLKLLYFGRLTQDKGVHTAIQALGLLKQRDVADNLELTVLGSGHPDYETKLRRMVMDLGISEKVEFIPQVTRDVIPTLLGRYDVYLFTSIWPEAMARSVMEAMAAGLLVIGTEVGGQVEMLVHGKNALTFKPEDVESLADHIIRAFYEPQLRLQLARAGQMMVLEQYTLDRMVDEMEELVQSIAKNVMHLQGE